MQAPRERERPTEEGAQTLSAPYRRFGEYVESDCDRWNADDREPISFEQNAASQPLSTTPSTEYTSNQEKPAESHERRTQ